MKLDDAQNAGIIKEIHSHSKITMRITRVDNVAMAGKKQDCNDLRECLNASFPANDLGELNHYVGCTRERDRKRGSMMMVQQLAGVAKLLSRLHITPLSLVPAFSTLKSSLAKQKKKSIWGPIHAVVSDVTCVPNMNCGAATVSYYIIGEKMSR